MNLSRLYREFFKALSNEARFSLVQLLRERPHYVGEMAEKLRMEQSRVSHHLACLLNCGFVLWEWSGKNKVYKLNADVESVLSGIDKHLDRFAPALNSCAVLGNECAPDSVPPKRKQAACHRHQGPAKARV